MKPTRTAPNGVPHLCARQTEIVRLIAEDQTAKQIGDVLGISPKTVEFHRHLIKQRLDVAGTAGIVRYAIRLGLVQP
jgi:DNA-binding CsgD family transcriptional regulator